MPELEPESTGDAQPEMRIGSYRLIERLGSGGMSSVLRAVHIETGHEVAVKVLPRYLAKNPTLLQRFLREAKSAESLEHPNIVAIYDRGFDQGRYYLVLEYLAGGDLHDHVRRVGPLSAEEAVKVIREVAEGLRYAASQGLIHRDIKPANILTTADGQVKVTDLGLALQVEDDDERVTRDGTTVGTVDYMSPEQARDSRATSVRSDLYSLGCTFFFLLTGDPPFPGGDVVEKLRRHMVDPPPDVRRIRPEVPEPLAKLVQRMMAKRPEDRFPDYDTFMAALAKVPGARQARGEPLQAIIDDDDDDDLPLLADEPAPARPSKPQPLQAIIDDDDDDDLPLLADEPAPPAMPQPLQAIIDSEDDDDLPALVALSNEMPKPMPLEAIIDEGPEPLNAIIEDDEDKPGAPATAAPAARPRPGAGGSERDRQQAHTPTEINLAALAPLETQDEPDGSTYRPSPGRKGRVAAKEGLQVFDDRPERKPTLAAAADAAPPHSTDEKPAKMWVVGGVLAGAVVVLVAIGAIWLSNQGTGPTVETEESAPEEKAPAEQAAAQKGEPPAVAVVQPPKPPVPAPGQARKPVQTKAITKPAPPPAPQPQPAAVATVPPSSDVPEKSYAAALESQFVPAWTGASIPQRVAGPYVKVQRVPETLDNEHAPTLARAFESIGGTIELEDDGPFFEDEFRIAGKDRLIRARPGLRPTIKVEAPSKEFVRSQPAVFVLEGSHLMLDGIDLVVDAAALPPKQSALFLLRGASLTLHNCSITILNEGGRPFSLVRIDEPGSSSAGSGSSGLRTSRVWLEKTLVRGAQAKVLELAGGPVEVCVSRSVALCPNGSFVSAARASGSESPGTRKVHFVRSLVATSGPLVSLASPPSASGPAAPAIRALGSSFVRFKTAEPVSLVAADEEGSGGVRELLDWQGADNTLAGWNSWLTIGANKAQRVADLIAARAAWPGTDTDSHWVVEPWPTLAAGIWARPADLWGLAQERRASLARVAAPGPFLGQKTVGAIERLRVDLNIVGPPAPAAARAPARPPGTPPGAAAAPAAPVSEVAELEFDALAAPWNGDLGQFLQQQQVGKAHWLRIRVRGFGTRPLTPIQLPEGLSLEVLVQPPDPAHANDPLTWLAQANAPGEALFDVRKGDLILSGVRLKRDKSPRLRNLVRVDEGRVLLNQCWLTTTAAVRPAEGTLLSFRALGAPAALAPGRGWPVCRLVDCVLLTGGDAITADMGQGVVALEQCALACGGDAFALTPRASRADSLQADLWLDHCTLAAAHAFVNLGQWAGPPGGPDRPWLVSSYYSAFLAAFGRNQESVLLRGDPGSLANCVLFWQGNGDADDVVHFTARGNAPPLANPRPDVQRQWVELWGQNHMVNVTGPALNGSRSSVRPRTDPMRPGQVSLADLALDPAHHAGRTSLDVGADLRRLSAAGSAPGAPGGYPVAPTRTQPGMTPGPASAR